MLTIADIIDARLKASKLGRQDLSGIILDLEHPFEGMSEVRSFAARETGNKAEMVAVSLEAGEAGSLQQIVNRLQHAWAESCFFDFQASSTVIYRDAIVMRFVTGDEHDQFLYTGSISVSGGTFETLRKKFERDFYTLPGRS